MVLWALAGFIFIFQLSTLAAATTAFGCRNSLIADEWRAEVLKLSNDKRAKLAKGKQAGSARDLPVAKNMKQLYWDCNIEEMVQNAAKNCPADPVVPNADPHKYGSASGTKTTAGECDAITMAEEILTKWWDEGAKKQANEAKQANNKIFSQMAYSETNGFACAYQKCAPNFYLLCFYNKNGNGAAVGNLYNAGGTTCEACAATCADGLCPTTPYTPASDLTPQCTLAKSGLMTNDLRTMALNMHNFYRRTLATGWAKDPQGEGGYAARAKEMKELTYNCDVENTIMTALERCVGTPSADVADQLQNFEKVDKFTMTREAVLEDTIREWWSALATTGVANNVFKDTMKVNDLGKYANMATDKATGIGCGVQICTAAGNTLVQCDYKVTAELADGDQIYKKGAPCQCTGGMKCSPLGGLCYTPAP